MQVKEQAIILRATRYGEADLILHCLTRSGNPISLMAKSALKSKKRFGGGILEPSHFVKISYKIKSSAADRLPILEEAELVEGFPCLRLDYERLQLALYFLQVVEKVCREAEGGATELFNLLGNALRAAEKGNRLSELKNIFEIKFLDQQGVLPHDEEYLPVINHSIRDLTRAPLSTNFQSKEKLRELLSNYIG